MASTSITTAGTTLFPAELVAEMFSKVKGHSALASLSGQTPIPFAGREEMIFSLDGEAEIVGEGAQKGYQNAEVTPVVIRPVKFVYQHRVTDEFMRCSDEKRLPYLQAFADGFAKKIARGLDIAAFHGINPKAGTASTVVGSNHFDSVVTQTTTFTAGTTAADDVIDTAIAAIQGANGDVTGMALSPAFAAALGQVKANGVTQYPEFRFGGRPAAFAGLAVDVNSTVPVALAAATNTDQAIIGDFQNAFRWGYAANIPMEIIQYGDPDGQGDLKRLNQVELRAEAYIGWGILDAASFARVIQAV